MANEQIAQENLTLIREMMETGRRRAGIDGSHMVLWGGILMAAFLLQYAAVTGYLPKWSLEIWIPALVIGWVGSFWIGRTQQVECTGQNLALTAYTTAWLSVGVGCTAYFTVTVLTGAFNPQVMSILTAALMATAYFVIIRVTGMRALYFAPVGWWGLLGYFSLLDQYGSEQLLIMAAASAVLVILPGQLMRRLARADFHTTEE